MKIILQNWIKLSLNMVLLGILCAPISANAQETSSETSVDESSSEVPIETDGLSSGSGMKPEKADSTTATESETTEGASSFSNLCGNGQGKPGENEVRKKRKGIFGLADRAAAMTRKIPMVGDMMVDTANSLSQSLACRLYPEEQKQAAEATEQVAQSEEIGNTVEWKSTVRENVSGSSTVSAKNKLANGTPCLTITDVAIVDGDEIRLSKKMCKLPGAHRYTIVNA
ncbi:MAG: hypothetical protein Pars2KO_23030 [Parasphingorhabdus sp.]